MAWKFPANQYLSKNKHQNLYAIVNLKFCFDPFLLDVLYRNASVFTTYVTLFVAYTYVAVQVQSFQYFWERVD